MGGSLYVPLYLVDYAGEAVADGVTRVVAGRSASGGSLHRLQSRA